MLVGQMQHQEAVSRPVKPMHPHDVVTPPAGRWRLETLAFLRWNRRAVLWERAADAGLAGRRDEPADGHHPHQGQEAGRCFASARSGQKLGSLEAAAAARGRRLPFGPGQARARGPLALVAFVRREDEPLVRVDPRLTGRAPRRQGCDARGDARVRPGARAGTPPLPLLGCGADGAVVETRGRPGVGTLRQGLLGLRCTGEGRAAQRLAGFACAVPLLAPRRVDGTLGLRLARPR